MTTTAPAMRRLSAGIFIIALTTLLLELALTRVFDVILHSNMAYMIITSAMFAFGLSGIYRTLRPIPTDADPRRGLAFLSISFAVLILLIRPALNTLDLDYRQLAVPEERLPLVVAFFGMYFVLAAPFFVSGLVFSYLFSAYTKSISRLYFWDLVGAGCGCILLIPLLPPVGPGGAMFCAGGLALLGAACFSPSKVVTTSSLVLGLLLIGAPFLSTYDYLDFEEQLDKRGVKDARTEGRIELTLWDPISKIDIVDFGANKHIAYDGGQQSSWFFGFDGNFDALRKRIHETGSDASFYEEVEKQFWRPQVLACHYLKRDSGHKALIVGCAGGHEAKAALMYGAAEVDAVELVGTVVELAQGRYAKLTGELLTDSRVNLVHGEGRSFLQAGADSYDIIQIFSNATTGSIASGSGAMTPNYLLTSEAFEQYFRKLSDSGILQINFFVYPRMLTTAARGWRNLGREDFRRHVLVYAVKSDEGDSFPSFMIKMDPWTEDELADLKAVFRDSRYELVENPLDPEASFLSDSFYEGEIPAELAAKLPFRAEPCSDDRPYFNFMRKRVEPLSADPDAFLNTSTAAYLNSQLALDKVPMDSIHLFMTAAASIFYAILFIGLPLFFSEAGRSRWDTKYSSICYFACLGAGFIMFELIFIQLFIKLIGYPLYTYATVLFTMLVAAGIGSEASARLGIGTRRHWRWAFIGILASCGIFWITYPWIFDAALALPTALRIAISCALIFPMGFFLGMPFPLGLLAIADGPRGAVAWAWGMNGLFTLVGGLASVLISIFWGMRLTLFVSILVYVLATLLFARLRKGQLSPA